MGARINFIFQDETDTSVVLYSHWGQDLWQQDLAAALQHAKPRWSDSSYGTRMIISYLTKDDIFAETGFGLFSLKNDNFNLGEQVIIVDFVNKTIIDRKTIVAWDDFVAAYSPPTV
jgi:hypothetical protein